MPRSKEGKKRSKPIAANVLAAAKRVLEDGVKVREAARECQVARTTLQRYLAFQDGRPNPEAFFTRCAVWSVFTKDEELQLVNYLLQSSKMHYGLSRKEVRNLAFEYAKLNGKAYPATWEQHGQAGEKWYTDFMRRHEAVLSLRKPQATSLARATAFNRQNVGLFFDKYSEVMIKNEFPPERIYNIDESAITTVHVPVKVVAGKGAKQVGSVTSGERGLNTTIICGINALGNSIPPMIIFPRVHFKPNMLKGAPPGTLGSAHVTGWSTAEKFIEFMNHFIHHVKPSPEEKVLLLMDNHETHVTIEAIDLAKKNGIVLLTFPPHTSHKLQPLDRGVFGPLKKYYNTACTEWLYTHCGTPLSIYDTAENFGKAYPRAFTPTNIQSGFRVSGIWPFNRDIFTDDEFLSSSVTDRAYEPQGDNSVQRTSANNAVRPTFPTPGNEVYNNTTSTASTSAANGSICSSTPEQVRPYPKAAPRKSKGGGRQPGKCRVLTDTPEKLELLATQAAKEAKKTAKEVAKMARESGKQSKNTDKSLKQKKIKSKGTSCRKLNFISSPSTTDEECLEMDSDSVEDCDWPPVLEQDEPFNDSLTKGDFCLTKLMGKTGTHYYVVEIIDIESDIFYIKYLKKVPMVQNKFLYHKDDVYEMSKEDIVMKLPQPSSTGGSARQCLQLAFGVDFAGFNVE